MHIKSGKAWLDGLICGKLRYYIWRVQKTIDLLCQHNAETVQIKDVRKSVTLKSQDILDSIAHFWEHQENNRNYKVHFRFLTTAERGKEKGNPFGSRRGLDYWDACKRSDSQIAPLRKFLQKQGLSSDRLQQFISNSNDEELRENLIRRIEWDTGNKPSEYIEDLIKKKVSYYGNDFGITPFESEKVVPHLLEKVRKVILQENDRYLEYYDFMILFEKVTSENVPKHELNRLRQESQLLGSLLPLGDSEKSGIVHVDTHLTLTPPPLPQRISARKKLIAKLISNLIANGIIVLQGSAGMGKSTLAKLIVHNHSDNWKWLDMRGLKPEQIRERLFQAASSHANDGTAKVVIDDLNFENQSQIYENALLGLIHIVLSQGGFLILTTQTQIPNRILLHFQIPIESTISIPPMELDEIKELATIYQCPSEKMLNIRGAIIFAKTRGHPQLVHAMVQNLEASNWPKLRINNFYETTEDIKQVRREARKTLSEQMPSEEARTLAYRLSILIQPFRRDQALQFGMYPTKLPRPGEAFDLLLGPWIERISDKYYRTSPLLDGAAMEVLSPEELNELHKIAADVILSCGSISPPEVNNMLFHGITGKSDAPIIVTLNSLTKVEGELWETISQNLIWLPYLATEPGQKIYSSNLHLNALLRILQFKIARDIDVEAAIKIADIWEKDIDLISDDNLKFFLRLMYLSDIIIHYKVPFSFERILSNIAEHIRLVKNIDKYFVDPPGDKNRYDLSDLKGPDTFIEFAIARIQHANDLQDFLIALEELSFESRQEILSIVHENNGLIGDLLTIPLYKEQKFNNPDYDVWIKAFKKMAELGKTWDSIVFIVASYRSLAIIHQELLKNSNDALESLAEGERVLDHKHPIFEEYRASIFFLNKEDRKALNIWENTLPTLEEGGNTGNLYSYRNAAICAANIDDWNKAMGLALKGEQAALKLEESIMAVAFRADYAFASWKENKKETAINEFASLLDSFKNLPAPNKNLRVFALYKFVGHAIGWLSQNMEIQYVAAQDLLYEPPPGYFTNPQFDENIKELPLTPLAALLYLLAQIEYEIECGSKIFDRLQRTINDDDSVQLRFTNSQLRIKHLLSTKEFNLLVDEFEKFSKIYNESFDSPEIRGLKTGDIKTKVKKFDEEGKIGGLINLLCAAVFKMVCQKENVNAPLREWRNDAKRLRIHNERLDELFLFLENLENKNLVELTSILLSDNRIWDKKFFAALIISTSTAVPANDRFYADLFLFAVLEPNDWKKEVEKDFESLVSKGWSHLASEQKFYLTNPILNAPEILNNCNDSSQGLKKVAKILLAAKNAVEVRVPDDLLKKLRKVATN